MANDHRHPSGPRALVPVVITLILVLAGVYVFQQIRNLPVDIAKAFKQGTITRRFISYATEIRGVRHLEVVKCKEIEIFSDRDEQYIAWGLIPLRDVEVEFRCPVETVYFVDLKGHWVFVVNDRKITVLAPPIEFNTPAISFSDMEFRNLKGEWLAPFRSKTVAENLKQKISTLVKLRARENVPNILDQARKEVEGFIRGWLLHDFTEKDPYQVEVRFPEEPIEPNQPLPSRDR